MSTIIDMVDKVSITIPSDIKYIREVSSGVLKSLSVYKLSEDSAFDIRLCVEEALNNAIEHGNGGDKGKSVKIDYWTEGNRIIIDIADEGKGFSPGLLPDPTVGDNVLRNSGRGVYLIKRLMDKIEYNSTGNKIRMMKSLK